VPIRAGEVDSATVSNWHIAIRIKSGHGNCKSRTRVYTQWRADNKMRGGCCGDLNALGLSSQTGPAGVPVSGCLRRMTTQFLNRSSGPRPIIGHIQVGMIWHDFVAFGLALLSVRIVVALRSHGQRCWQHVAKPTGTGASPRIVAQKSSLKLATGPWASALLTKPQAPRITGRCCRCWWRRGCGRSRSPGRRRAFPD
jgi:hypothetical protein